MVVLAVVVSKYEMEKREMEDYKIRDWKCPTHLSGYTCRLRLMFANDDYYRLYRCASGIDWQAENAQAPTNT